MKAVRLFTILFITSLIISKAHGQTKYEKYGISFTVPAGWKITDEEKGTGVFTFLCEKKGDDGPSVSFVYIDGPTGVDDMLKSTMADYDNETMAQGMALNWQNPISGKIGTGGYATRQVSFSADDGRDVENGTIYAFSLCGKTALVVFTDSEQGHEENVAAFDTIKNSFSCK